MEFVIFAKKERLNQGNNGVAFARKSQTDTTGNIHTENQID